MFYLRRDRNSVGLGDYDYYLRDGCGKLVNSLDNIGIGVVAGITNIIVGVPISQWSSTTSWWSINFNVPFKFIANCHGTGRSTATMGG